VLSSAHKEGFINWFITCGFFYKRTVKKSVYKKDHNVWPIVKNRFTNNQFMHSPFTNGYQAGWRCSNFQLHSCLMTSCKNSNFLIWPLHLFHIMIEQRFSLWSTQQLSLFFCCWWLFIQWLCFHCKQKKHHTFLDVHLSLVRSFCCNPCWWKEMCCLATSSKSVWGNLITTRWIWSVETRASMNDSIFSRVRLRFSSSSIGKKLELQGRPQSCNVSIGDFTLASS